MIHAFGDEIGSDAIPIYENFCFALALMRQKTIEGIGEGKELVERLLPFQSPEGQPWAGNFPIYLHDFPRCRNPVQPLKIAPVLMRILGEFSRVLGEEFKAKLQRSLDLLLEASRRRRIERPFDPLWERRYLALIKQPISSAVHMNSADWFEELVTRQIAGEPTEEISRLIHPNLGVYAGPSPRESQLGSQPASALLEWWAFADQPKLQDIHASQFSLACLLPMREKLSLWSGTVGSWSVVQTPETALSFAEQFEAKAEESIALRLLWGGRQIHSLAASFLNARGCIEKRENGARMDVLFTEEMPSARSSVVETALFCNLSPETSILVDGVKATAFHPGQSVKIQTGSIAIELNFQTHRGEFFGQISRANRPFQLAARGSLEYEAFDWKISLSTIKRESDAAVSVELSIRQS